MNTIKYINSRTGETKVGKVDQPSYSKMMRRATIFTARLPSMRELDQHMNAKGFVRAGKRWAGADAKAALRANADKAFAQPHHGHSL